MAEVERRATAAQPAPAQSAATDIDKLPALLGRLSEHVTQFVDTKLSLIKVELKEDASVYARNGVMMAVGGLVAAIVFMLFNVAIAFFVSKLFSFADPRLNYALGFVITGLVYLVAGAAILLMAKGRLAAHDPTPNRSLEEIRKDKQWLKNEI